MEVRQLKETITMWKHTRMVVLTALTAALYAAILIPFKPIPIIPGVTELRPGNVIPFVFGILFGPAGAWGSAIGNLIADFFGTLGPGSFFGFIGNFFLGLTAYKMWNALGRGKEEQMSRITAKFAVKLVLSALTSSAVCALIIAWGLDLLGMVPFAFLGSVIMVNNSLVTLILGPPLLFLLHGRVKRWGLLWVEILDRKEIPLHFLPLPGVILMVMGALGGLGVGFGLSTGLYGAELFEIQAGSTGSGVVFVVIPFLVVFLAGLQLVERQR
jgi:energy-coupling factor transport system substrate-specific component